MIILEFQGFHLTNSIMVEKLMYKLNLFWLSSSISTLHFFFPIHSLSLIIISLFLLLLLLNFIFFSPSTVFSSSSSAFSSSFPSSCSCSSSFLVYILRFCQFVFNSFFHIFFSFFTFFHSFLLLFCHFFLHSFSVAAAAFFSLGASHSLSSVCTLCYSYSYYIDTGVLCFVLLNFILRIYYHL